MIQSPIRRYWLPLPFAEVLHQFLSVLASPTVLPSKTHGLWADRHLSLNHPNRRHLHRGDLCDGQMSTELGIHTDCSLAVRIEFDRQMVVTLCECFNAGDYKG